MKRIITFLIIATLILTSCIQKPNIDFKVEIGNLNNLLKNNDESSQFFIYNSDSIVTMTGKNGTIFIFNPSDLITESGREINDSINVELKELTNQYQMARANAQTVSNNKLLVSGGAYFIGMTSNGEKVKLKPNKKFKISFPVMSQDNMSLFSGNRDSIGQLDWIPTDINLKNEREIRMELERLQLMLISELQGRDGSRGYGPRARMLKSEIEKLRVKLKGGALYPEIEFGNIKWINCDRFLDIKIKTDLRINFRQSEKISTANIFLIFKDINSVIQEYYLPDKNEKNAYVAFNNIPMGANVRLVAYTLKEKKIFTYSSNMTLKENEILTLDMKETSANEFKALFYNN